MECDEPGIDRGWVAPSRGRRQTFGSVLMKQFPNLSEFGSLCTTLTRNAREARISFDCFQILAEIQVNTVNTKWRTLSVGACFVPLADYNVNFKIWNDIVVLR